MDFIYKPYLECYFKNCAVNFLKNKNVMTTMTQRNLISVAAHRNETKLYYFKRRHFQNIFTNNCISTKRKEE